MQRIFCAASMPLGTHAEYLLSQIRSTNSLYFILNGLTWFLPGLRVLT